MSGTHVDALVLAATDLRRAHADAILAAHPEIEQDFSVQLVLGRPWDGDPTSRASRVDLDEADVPLAGWLQRRLAAT
jgi:hypothetical protein